MDDAAKLLGYGDGKLEILRIQCLVRIGAVKVDQAQEPVAEQDGRADQAGGAQ